jgi:hypothetical protein
LHNKIQQVQSQITEGISGGGVSAISTIGGITGGNQDYSSNNNPFKKNKDQGLFRKNSSILSTANRNQFQINTPSALGYTSVLLGGPAGPSPHYINLAEEQELRAKNIIISSDLNALHLFDLKQDV